jgi:hypothetical protein
MLNSIVVNAVSSGLWMLVEPSRKRYWVLGAIAAATGLAFLQK